MRFEHVVSYADSAKYPKHFEEFLANEKNDEAAGLGQGLEFRTAELMKTADFHIDASGILRETFRQMEDILRERIASCTL